MDGWTSSDLRKIGDAEELNLASLRSDGTLRPSVVMWVVRHGDDLDVRSVNERGSSWFRGAQARHQGHIRAGSVEQEVGLVETDELSDAVDNAYREKYGKRYPSIVPSIVGPGAREATLKLVPRSTES